MPYFVWKFVDLIQFEEKLRWLSRNPIVWHMNAWYFWDSNANCTLKKNRPRVHFFQHHPAHPLALRGPQKNIWYIMSKHLQLGTYTISRDNPTPMHQHRKKCPENHQNNYQSLIAKEPRGKNKHIIISFCGQLGWTPLPPTLYVQDPPPSLGKRVKSSKIQVERYLKFVVTDIVKSVVWCVHSF